MTIRTYSTADAFRMALDQRLQSSSGMIFTRRRQLLVFDRLLARVVQVMNDTVVVKGGLVLELRLDRARTTRDIDLRMIGSPVDLLERLRGAGRLDLGDFMRFELAPDPRHPTIQNEGMKYDGSRFRCECRLGGRLYGNPFGVDIAFADPIVGEPDEIVADDHLGFAGIPPPRLRIYPVVSHIAEKLHAYTLPRTRPSSRTKDLPDLALLATTGPIEASSLRRALDQTFAHRGTHAVPAALPAPPSHWAGPYEELAREDELPWATLAAVDTAARMFLEPVLAGATITTWNPRSSSWGR